MRDYVKKTLYLRGYLRLVDHAVVLLQHAEAVVHTLTSSHMLHVGKLQTLSAVHFAPSRRSRYGYEAMFNTDFQNSTIPSFELGHAPMVNMNCLLGVLT